MLAKDEKRLEKHGVVIQKLRTKRGSSKIVFIRAMFADVLRAMFADVLILAF